MSHVDDESAILLIN